MSRGAENLPARERSRAFTLIEVLAALVIVALGMLGVIQAVTQTARNGTYLRDKTLAHWIAMNVITERRLMPTPPEVAENSDEVDFADQRWRWTMKVTQTEVASLRRMDVAVRRADRPDGDALITVTGFYGTAIGAAGGDTLPWANGGGTSGEDDATEEATEEGDATDGNREDGDARANRPRDPARTPRDRRREVDEDPEEE